VSRSQHAGLLVQISSIAGIADEEFLSAYAAAKFGVEGWFESLTPEVAPFGIRTLLVEPGFLGTDLLTRESTDFAESTIEDYAQRTKDTVAQWQSMNGKQGGEPAKLADALLQLVGHDETRCGGSPGPTPSDACMTRPSVSGRALRSSAAAAQDVAAPLAQVPVELVGGEGEPGEAVGVLGSYAVQDDGEMAPPLVRGALAGDGHGLRDSEQSESHVPRGQVGPHGASLLSAGEQVRQQGAESLPPVRADREQGANGTVSGPVRHEVLEVARQSVPGIRVGERLTGHSLPTGVPALEELLDELLLGEVAVQGGIADPGSAGNLDQAHPEPVIGKRPGGRGQDAVAVLAGIAPLVAHWVC